MCGPLAWALGALRRRPRVPAARAGRPLCARGAKGKGKGGAPGLTRLSRHCTHTRLVSG